MTTIFFLWVFANYKLILSFDLTICDSYSSTSYSGVKEQKQYSVKYKGLAHIHNHWVPEIQLRHEVPELLAEFDEKKEVTVFSHSSNNIDSMVTSI